MSDERAHRYEAGRRLALGFLAATVVAAAWVGLTALTGKTYHLAPLITAMLPGFAPVVAVGGERSLRVAGAAAVTGALAASLGWIAIVVLGVEPTATVFEAQPGGVLGEVIAGTTLGAIAASLAVLLRLGPTGTLSVRSGRRPGPPT